MTRLLILAVAALGFAFDTYELLTLPLIIGPALADFGLTQGTPEYAAWVGRLFYVPAVAGGLFGLLGGYLTDLFGRRRVLTWSIILYSVSASASALAPSPGWLLALRCCTFVGVCVEFVAATAWLAELFPDHRDRERALGYTQAFGSLGGLLASAAYYKIAHVAQSLPAIAGSHAPWRYLLVSGLVPAIPLVLLRPFLPESPSWAQKKAAGTLRRPSLAAIFAPELRRVTLVSTLMMAASFAVAFGALQHLPRIVPGIPTVRPLEKNAQQAIVSNVQVWQEVGGLLGRLALAFLAVKVASRRTLIRLFLLPALLVIPAVFYGPARSDLELLRFGALAAGLLAIGQFSFWGNYLPRVYPVDLRGTGESFAANVGGRMIGTAAAWLTSTLSTMPITAQWAGSQTAPARLAIAAAVVATGALLVGCVASCFLPEPEH